MASTTCIGCIEDQPNQLAHMEEGGCLNENEWGWGSNHYDLGREEDLKNTSNKTTFNGGVNGNENIDDGSYHSDDSYDSESGEDYEYLELDNEIPDVLKKLEAAKLFNAKEKVIELKNIIKTFFSNEYKNEIKCELIELLKSMDTY